MITDTTEIRVRYGETDKMGYVYYGTYPQYYEVGRTELIRKYGISYKLIEEIGIMLPVKYLEIKYFKPALYDDVLTIKTMIKILPSVKIEFEYEVYNQNNDLLNTGSTALVFVDEISRKPVKMPEILLNKIKKYFK